MNIELKDKNGITLKTAGKYCSEDVGIVPKLQSKNVATNGSVVADGGYCGLDSVTVDVPATPTQEKTVDLAMASGNQVISPDAGKNLSKVTVTKPSTLVAENIKTGVSIGGVTGTLETQKEEEVGTATITANGSQTFSPTSGKVFSKFTTTVNVQPKLQTKSATPTKSQQIISSDSSYDGLSSVTVNAIPDDYIIPSGSQNITANGTYDITGKASVVVDVPSLQPTLNAPTISLSYSTLTITNPASNGNFVTKFKVFSNGAALTEATIKGSTTTVDLSTLLTTAGTYSITAKASAANFNDSAASSAVEYVVQAAQKYTINVTNTGSYDITFEQNGVTLATVDGSGGGGTGSGSFEAEAGTVTSSTGALYTQADTVVTGGISVDSVTSTSPTFTITGAGTITVDPWCIIEGTKITLADGTTKAVEDITYDDELLVWNFYAGRFDKAKPTWIKIAEIAPRYNLVKFSNGTEVGFVGAGGEKGYHRIFNKEAGAFTYTGNLKETPNGTTTFAQDETFPTVISQEVIEKEVKFYNIITDKHYNIFANGILTSCKLSNKYHIEDMRYIGEKLISDEQKKAYFERIEDKRK